MRAGQRPGERKAEPGAAGVAVARLLQPDEAAEDAVALVVREPGPVSATTTAQGSPASTHTVIAPPSGVWRRELSSRSAT